MVSNHKYSNTRNILSHGKCDCYEFTLKPSDDTLILIEVTVFNEDSNKMIKFRCGDIFAVYTSEGKYVDGYGFENMISYVLSELGDKMYDILPSRFKICTYHMFGNIELYSQADRGGNTLAYFESPETGEYCIFDANTCKLIESTFKDNIVGMTLESEVKLRQSLLLKFRPCHILEVHRNE